MITTQVKATLDPHGAIEVNFNCDIDSHQARELLDAISSVLNASHTGGKVIHVEKDEESLTRRPPVDLDQEEIPEVVQALFEVIGDPKQISAPDVEIVFDDGQGTTDSDPDDITDVEILPPEPDQE